MADGEDLCSETKHAFHVFVETTCSLTINTYDWEDTGIICHGVRTVTHVKLQPLPPSYDDHSVQNRDPPPSYPTEFHHQPALSFSEPYPQIHFSPQYSYPTGFQNQHASSFMAPYSQIPVASGPTIVVVSEPLPEDYLGLSIFATFCGFLPLGLVAICFSAAANRANVRNDRKSAQKYGCCALIVSILSIITDIIIVVVVVVTLNAKSRSYG